MRNILELIEGYSGTFLTATPSGVLSATTPSRGPLESFVPFLATTSSSPFPTFSLKTHAEKYLSATPPAGPSIIKSRAELRADADVAGEGEMLRVKCQREFVLKAKIAIEDAKGEGKGKTRMTDGGPAPGSLEDEMKKK